VTHTDKIIGEGLAMDPDGFGEVVARLESELARVIVGQEAVLRDTVVALLAGGHVLFEGVPGLGKTVLVRTLARVLGLGFARVQFTPDLMPADIVGTTVIEEGDGVRRFRYQPGPVFANLVLADEINRATPKTQSALLEAMQERTVTAGGETRPLPAPFFVFATQNPIEMEGTYALPEAQLDRFFFKLTLPFPSAAELAEIARRTTGTDSPELEVVAERDTIVAMSDLARAVPLADHVLDYAVRLITATHPDRSNVDEITRHVRYGASPRGLQALVQAGKIRALIAGRYNVAFADIREAARPALRHRILLRFEAEASGVDPDQVIGRLLDEVVTDPQAAG
jgi:MoxR-like ATPase